MVKETTSPLASQADPIAVLLLAADHIAQTSGETTDYTDESIEVTGDSEESTQARAPNNFNNMASQIRPHRKNIGDRPDLPEGSDDKRVYDILFSENAKEIESLIRNDTNENCQLEKYLDKYLIEDNEALMAIFRNRVFDIAANYARCSLAIHLLIFKPSLSSCYLKTYFNSLGKTNDDATKNKVFREIFIRFCTAKNPAVLEWLVKNLHGKTYDFTKIIQHANNKRAIRYLEIALVKHSNNALGDTKLKPKDKRYFCYSSENSNLTFKKRKTAANSLDLPPL